MPELVPMLEDAFDLADSDEKLTVRIFAPVFQERTTWTCRAEIGAPIGKAYDVPGEGALQALTLALSFVSANLYSHPLWRGGQIGKWGQFGGFLGVPAPTQYLDFAPFPF